MTDYAEEGLALSDLMELVKGGAKIKIDRPVQRIAQVDELVTLFKELIATNRARIEADAERNKSQLEILATLQALIRSGNVTKSQKLDLAPLNTVLAKIEKTIAHPVHTVQPAKPARPVGYEFTIGRDKRTGFADKIVAIPKTAS